MRSGKKSSHMKKKSMSGKVEKTKRVKETDVNESMISVPLNEEL